MERSRRFFFQQNWRPWKLSTCVLSILVFPSILGQTCWWKLSSMTMYVISAQAAQSHTILLVGDPSPQIEIVKVTRNWLNFRTFFYTVATFIVSECVCICKHPITHKTELLLRASEICLGKGWMTLSRLVQNKSQKSKIREAAKNCLHFSIVDRKSKML